MFCELVCVEKMYFTGLGKNKHYISLVPKVATRSTIVLLVIMISICYEGFITSSVFAIDPLLLLKQF